MLNEQYYSDKIGSLKEIFGNKNVQLKPGQLVVSDHVYPIINDVIILLDQTQYPQSLKNRIEGASVYNQTSITTFAEDIQFQYGECWKEFSQILPEYEREFAEYFDIVNLHELQGLRVCDLGCGMGRWSFMLQQKCELRELVLVDFSEAIFEARRLLHDSRNVLFFMGDITQLPFQPGFSDFLFCLGVLHHLPVNVLDEVRRLKKYSKKLLIYLYYACDNKPAYFRILLSLLSLVRGGLYRIRNSIFRKTFSWFGVYFIYLPCIGIGKLLKPLGLSKYVPLHEEHHWCSLEGLRHHVYDRFFTRIEQRVSRKEIMTLTDTYSKVIISDHPGYWHFLCLR